MSDLTPEAEKSRAFKLALRSRALTARRFRPPAMRVSAAAQLQDQILALVRREHPSTVAAYVPVGAEPGGADLPSVLAATGVRVLLPVLLGDNDLDWAVFTGALAGGRRGLSEPDGPRLGVDGIRSAELILVPALAVDPAGRRMGRGGGSYDRALARLTPPSPLPQAPGRSLVVALLHDGELVDGVPAEPHDRPVHGVITPTGGLVMFDLPLNRGAEWTK
jgi:5-formyltetrahydrofolate cyclo-ligase